MDVQMIRDDIRELVSDGETSYENCEKLVLLNKALKCLWEQPGAAIMDGDHIHTGTAPLTKAEAVAWVGEMENADGTRGGHWSMEQTEQVRKKLSIDCEPVEFYATMNMMYSDYGRVADKFSAGTPDFYACMAKAFLDDKDAQPGKLARYYRYVAGK